MEGEDAVEDRVHGLALVEGVRDEPEVSRSCGRVEAEVGDWKGVNETGEEPGAEDAQSRVTLYLASAR